MRRGRERHATATGPTRRRLRLNLLLGMLLEGGIASLALLECLLGGSHRLLEGDLILAQILDNLDRGDTGVSAAKALSSRLGGHSSPPLSSRTWRAGRKRPALSFGGRPGPIRGGRHPGEKAHFKNRRKKVGKAVQRPLPPTAPTEVCSAWHLASSFLSPSQEAIILFCVRSGPGCVRRVAAAHASPPEVHGPNTAVCPSLFSPGALTMVFSYSSTTVSI